MGANYSNRGNMLEEWVMYANNGYLNKGIARIDKIPTPTVVNPNKGYAYYKSKSTVDFIGFINNGPGIAFDCKETGLSRLPLKLVHQHQIDYLKDIHNLGHKAFILVYFTKQQEAYRLSFIELEKKWLDWKANPGVRGKGSIIIEDFKFSGARVCPGKGLMLDYLKGMY